MLLGKARKGF